jgi:hypothetical protein
VPLLLLLDQAAQEQRAKKGVVTTAVRGPTRPKSSSINTSGVYAEMFKAAIDEVERNHATQVCKWTVGRAAVLGVALLIAWGGSRSAQLCLQESIR